MNPLQTTAYNPNASIGYPNNHNTENPIGVMDMMTYSLGFVLIAAVLVKLVRFFLFPAKPKLNPSFVQCLEAGLIADENPGYLFDQKGAFVGWSYAKFKDGTGPNFPLIYRGDTHIGTFGRTGSGKNTTIQTPALLTYPGSALVLDVKGQLCAITARRRQEMGQDVFAINPFGLLGIPSVTYNPLSHIKPDVSGFATNCDRIAEAFVEHEEHNPFFSGSARDFVSIIIQWVIREEKEKSLLRVRQIVSLSTEERIKLFEHIATCEKYPTLGERAMRYTSDAKSVGECIETARQGFSKLYDDDLTNFLRGGDNEISFADLKRKKQTVYIIIPFEYLDTQFHFLRLLVMSALVELIQEDTIPDTRVLFMLDEFAALKKMSLITKSSNIIRDYHVTIWAIFQNLPQLYEIYSEHEIKSFLSTMGVTQVFTTNDTETARYFSERSGKRTVVKVTETVGVSASNAQGAGSSSRSHTTRTEEEPFFKPDFFSNLKENEQALFVAGFANGIHVGRLPYYNAAFYPNYADGRQTWDVDPYREGRDEFKRKAKAGEWVIKPKPVRKNTDLPPLPSWVPLPEVDRLYFDSDDYRKPLVACSGCRALSSFWKWRGGDTCPDCGLIAPPMLVAMSEAKVVEWLAQKTGIPEGRD